MLALKNNLLYDLALAPNIEIEIPVGSTKTRKRIGRGPGSGLGGTSTRGHKGAKSRSGSVSYTHLDVYKRQVEAIAETMAERTSKERKIIANEFDF